MFAALNQISDGAMPQFETKKALIIMGVQNDSFYTHGDFLITQNPEFVQSLRELVPYFRRIGEIIWVRTEMGILPTPPSPDAEKVELESVKQAEQNRKTRIAEEANLRNDMDKPHRSMQQVYDPSSRIKQLMTRASADTRSEKRSSNLHTLDDERGSMEEQLVKPRKGQQSRFFVSGTKGAEFADRIADLMKEEDMIIVKHFYSAFDSTALLTSLRMQLITETYIAGGLTNASIYSTAADAVQHGLGVTVVEDCLGYRNQDKHQEALEQMSDIMGVGHVTCEDIIEESGGRVIPDSNTPGITLQELSLSAEEKAGQAALLSSTGAASQLKGDNIIDAKNPAQAKAKSKAAAEMPPQRPDQVSKPAKFKTSLAKAKTKSLGPDDVIGSGDSKIVYDFLEPRIASRAFDVLRKEVDWQTMRHRGGQVPRLVAVQGQIGKDGEVPLYRHPADESPPLLTFSPTVWKIKRKVEELLEQPFNHALIQLYRDGDDNISEHADKTLDIVRGSRIVNVSLGAQRIMTLRTKKSKPTSGTDSPVPRNAQRVSMPHNSIFVLGAQSNREWLHGVRADKRPPSEKNEKEMAYEGERISITFRQIGTFMNEEENTIWGTGARNKTKATAARISNEDSTQMDAMIIAFGKENHQADFDWDAEYGAGFDVVNLFTSPGLVKLVLCSDTVANQRVRLCLEERSIAYEIVDRDTAEEQASSQATEEKPWIHGLANTENPILSNLTLDSPPIQGDLAILIHLEKHRTDGTTEESQQYTTTQLYSCIAQANELLYLWYELRNCTASNNQKAPPTHRFNLENPRPTRQRTPPGPEVSLRQDLHSMLKTWEDYLTDSKCPFIAGDHWSVIDCAFWPVFNSIVHEAGLSGKRFPSLLAYQRRAMARESVRRLVEGEGEGDPGSD